MISFTPVVYWTDFLVFILLIGIFSFLHHIRKREVWQRFKNVLNKKSLYQIATFILILYSMIGFLDSLHYKNTQNQHEVKSVLDVLLSSYVKQNEETYSAPFAAENYDPKIIKTEVGTVEQSYESLKYAGQHLVNPKAEKTDDILRGLGMSLLAGILFTFLLYFLFRKIYPENKHIAIWVAILIFSSLIAMSYFFSGKYHILGTDKIGRDVFYLSVKSIRTGLIIGTLTTFFMLPFAVILGLWAGYFRGWVDDIIQYAYITLSSVPGILLIAAAVLSLQLKIEQNPELRLLLLCVILGVTGWTGLCRLLRGETLKLREADFVKAATVLGVSHLKIIRHHIFPNLAHIMLITVVLDFSGLVLAEAVLSYVGVGVDPTSFSWGNLINASRLEMAREPFVWWSLMGAFILMFTLVFAANIFSDAVQEALDPRRN